MCRAFPFFFPSVADGRSFRFLDLLVFFSVCFVFRSSRQMSWGTFCVFGYFLEEDGLGFRSMELVDVGTRCIYIYVCACVVVLRVVGE